MNGEFSNLIVAGAGSIGKVHLAMAVQTNLFKKIIVIDPNPAAKEFLGDLVFTGIKSWLPNVESIQEPLDSYLAVISNWGPDHYASICALNKLGVRFFIVEKPLTSSLGQMQELIEGVAKKDYSIVNNLPLSNQVIVKRINELMKVHELGQVCSIIVVGGAKCLVTNGVHQLALACKLFNVSPTSVYADLNCKFINPRSPKFPFYGGSSTWNFGDGRYLNISFSNESRLQLSINIMFEYGKILIEGTSVFVSRVDKNAPEFKKNPTRTFYPQLVAGEQKIFLDSSGLDGMKSLYDHILKNETWSNFEHAKDVQEAIFGMLIANEKQTQITLPLSSRHMEEFYSIDWMIS